MARIYPKQVHPDTQPGEKQVYDQLTLLPDDWLVFHNIWELYKDDRKYVNYEADFIVIIPHLGIVVIEVKDWPHVRIKDGVWQSKGKKEESEWVSLKRTHTPLNQAFINAKRLTKSLEKRGIIPSDTRNQPEIRSLAILTNSSPPNLPDTATVEDKSICHKYNLPLDTLYLCGRAELETHLRTRLENLFTNKGKKGKLLTRDMVREIEDYLAPSMYFRLDFSNYTETMENAAQDLFCLLPRLEESTGGIRVEGCAGSGKTEMALREIRRLAAQNKGEKNILLLCYNNNLLYRLRRALKGCKFASSVIVSGFHDYCIQHIILPAGKSDLIHFDGQAPYLKDDGWNWIETATSTRPQHD